MKFGVNTYIWGSTFGPADFHLLPRIPASGFDGIEVPILDPASFQADAIARELDRIGLARTAVANVPGGSSLASSDPGQRQRARDHVAACVRAARDLGAAQLSGPMYTPVGFLTGRRRTTEEWQWAVDSWQQLAPAVETAGVEIGIEPLNRFETYLINRGDQALALADAVGPNCGVCLDLFHMNIEESDILGAFRKCKGRIYDVHIADNNRFAPGMGTLDFRAIVETIRSTGYDGALTLEFVATVDRTPASPYGDQVETKLVDVTPEQMKFIIDHGSNLLSDTFYTGLFQQSVKVLRPLI